MHFRHISAKIQLKKTETTFRLGGGLGPPSYTLVLQQVFSLVDK